MVTIRLVGEAGRRFGRKFQLAIKTPAEGLRALMLQIPGLREYLLESGDKGVAWKVITDYAQDGIDEEQLLWPISQRLVLAPVPVGRGGVPMQVASGARRAGWYPRECRWRVLPCCCGRSSSLRLERFSMRPSGWHWCFYSALPGHGWPAIRIRMMNAGRSRTNCEMARLALVCIRLAVRGSIPTTRTIRLMNRLVWFVKEPCR